MNASGKNKPPFTPFKHSNQMVNNIQEGALLRKYFLSIALINIFPQFEKNKELKHESYSLELRPVDIQKNLILKLNKGFSSEDDIYRNL